MHKFISTILSDYFWPNLSQKSMKNLDKGSKITHIGYQKIKYFSPLALSVFLT